MPDLSHYFWYGTIASTLPSASKLIWHKREVRAWTLWLESGTVTPLMFSHSSLFWPESRASSETVGPRDSSSLLRCDSGTVRQPMEPAVWCDVVWFNYTVDVCSRNRLVNVGPLSATAELTADWLLSYTSWTSTEDSMCTSVLIRNSYQIHWKLQVIKNVGSELVTFNDRVTIEKYIRFLYNLCKK